MIMDISASAALWFFPFVLPIAIWAAWSDLKFMKIPNMSVLALLAVFLIIGLIALPWADYPWRLLHLVVILVIGFVMNMIGMIGAGDAKFAAAMSPFVALGDAFTMGYILAASMLVGFVIHRLFQRSKSFRKLTSDWQSWENRDFPMGFPLACSLLIYLGLGIVWGGA